MFSITEQTATLPRIDVARLFINEHIAIALVRAGQTQGT